MAQVIQVFLPAHPTWTAPNVYIKAAIDASPGKVLTINEFVEVTQYDIKKSYVDDFFHAMKDEVPLYITQELINYCGYSGKNDGIKRSSFIRVLTGSASFTAGRDYVLLSNEKYREHYMSVSPMLSDVLSGDSGNLFIDDEQKNANDDEKSVSRPAERIPTCSDDDEKRVSRPADRKNGTNIAGFPNPRDFIGVNGMQGFQHIIVSSECFKHLLMKISENLKSDKVRNFYTALERLIKLYDKYQTRYNELLAERTNAILCAVRGDLAEAKQQRNQMTEMLKSSEAREIEAAEMLKSSEAREIEAAKMLKSSEAREIELAKIANYQGVVIEEQNVAIEENTQAVSDLTENLYHSNYERAPLLPDPSKVEQFAMFLVDEKHDPHFYVVKGQPASIIAGKKRAEKKYGSAAQVCDIPYQPNPRNMYNWVKIELSHMIARTHINDLWLRPEVTIEEFEAAVRVVDRKRFEII